MRKEYANPGGGATGKEEKRVKQRRENTKGRSVWNRAVALVVMFAMVITLFPFVPGVQPQAQAMKVTEYNYEIKADGSVHLWGTVIPTTGGSTKGDIKIGGDSIYQDMTRNAVGNIKFVSNTCTATS